MGLLGRRTPNVGKLRRNKDVHGLEEALAYSDRVVGRDGTVLDQGVGVRLEAVQALIELGQEHLQASDRDTVDAEIVPLLSRGLMDGSERVGCAAAQGLGQLGTPVAIEELVDFLALRPSAAQPEVRGVALDGVAASRCAGLTERWARKALERLGSLNELDRRDLAVIIGADSAPDPEGDLQQLLLPKLEPDLPGLASTQPPEAILEWCMPADGRALEPLLTRDEVPEAAVRLAGVSGDQALLQPLVALLSHDKPTIRREAVSALGALCDTAAVMPLLLATTDPDVTVRRGAVSALDTLGSAGVTAAMALLSSSAGAPAELEEAEQPATKAGERWIRTLERMAERAFPGRGQRRLPADGVDQMSRLVGIKTRYDALLNGPDALDAGDGPS
jgi:HEAT repeat protein